MSQTAPIPRWLTILLGMFIAIGPAATDMYLPAFPAVEASYGTAPGTAQLHGAACHGCLLVPETSCEQRNDFLDRALVVPTVESPDAAFFEGVA